MFKVLITTFRNTDIIKIEPKIFLQHQRLLGDGRERAERDEPGPSLGQELHD